jgi:hypothetical protein
MRHLGYACAIAVLMSAGPASADTFDGSAPLICAINDLQSCAAGEGCRRELPMALNLSSILRIDVAKKSIDGKRPNGEKHTTPIDTVRKGEQGLVLQGIDGGRSWSAVIDPEGGLSIALVGIDAGFIVFGECTSY